MKNEIVVLGGGTFEPISNHLSISAPAFGTTAKEISSILGGDLYLTKMADSASNLKTGEDVSKFVDSLLENQDLKCIVMNIAFCDFYSEGGDFHGKRKESSDGEFSLNLKPTDKIIDRIRKSRPDVFLVGFKTTTNASENDQFLKGLKMMKRSKCNLVLANDVVTRNNIIITPEETFYGSTTDRKKTIEELCDMIKMRMNATYNRSIHEEGPSYDIRKTSSSFQTVVKFLIDNQGFLENNGNGFTPGHFCELVDGNKFLSSQRKANHNLVFDEGMSLVEVHDNDSKFIVRGKRKASVGARSQWMMLSDNKEYDCIVHTHNPLKEGSKIPITPQKPFQCGSVECGLNSLNNLGTFGDIKAVYLDKHGANIMFKSTSDSEDVIKFIKNNIVLGIKTT